MEQKAITLGYWNIRGLAERVRHLLQFLSVPYKQEKYHEAQGRIKWFDQVKPQLINKNPAVTLPYLIDGDKVITQADAICIHVCQVHKLELLGRNLEEKIALATVRGVYKDLYPAYNKLVYGNYSKDFTFQQALSESIENFNFYLTKINGLLSTNQFIAGGLTWFDFVLADFLQTLTILNKQYLRPFPKLIEYMQRVWGLPQLKEYFNSDRFKERPCNNYTAAWK